MAPHAASDAKTSHTAIPKRPTMLGAMLMPLSAAIGRMTHELRLRQDQRRLSRMDDFQLSDLGISRGQIEDAVRTGRISLWLERR